MFFFHFLSNPVRKQRRKTVNIRGFPGSGKTTLMALIVIALKECADMTVLWTAVNVNAVREAAHRIDQLLTDASDEIKQSYVRFLSQKEEPSCSIDVSFSERRRMIGHVLRQRVILMTEDGFLVEHSFAYTKMNIQADISLKDESQQGGTPAHAFQLASLHPDGIAVNVGDPSQTKLAVDSRNLAMKKLVLEIESRDPCIRCQTLNWVPTNEWCRETCRFLSLECDQDDGTGIAQLGAILEFVVNESFIDPPTSADMSALRIAAPPQLTVAKSYRMPPFPYQALVAVGYPHLVSYQENDDGRSCSISLGELTGSAHNCREHLIPDCPQIVWIQPWGWSLYASVESHFRSVLAILVHMCIQRKSLYYSHLQLGVVISHRSLYVLVLAHFEKQKPDCFSDVVIRKTSTFTSDSSLSMLANIALALGKSCEDVTHADVLKIFTDAPWVVRDFVGISTQMSAVGSEKLDVLAYKMCPGSFVDKEDQGIVTLSRQKGNLLVYCDYNRVRGLCARFAAIVVRCCPILYWSAHESYSVKDRLLLISPESLNAIDKPSQAVPSRPVDASSLPLAPPFSDEPKVSEILEKASTSWDAIPLCIAVHVTTDSSDEVRFLYGRPYTPCHPKSCNAPNGFWVDDWTTWSWESCEWTRETEHWSLRSRVPSWKLRIGQQYAASLSHVNAVGSKSFQMNVNARGKVRSVHVAIMPAYVFPTHTRWSSSDIMTFMLKLRNISIPPGLTGPRSQDQVIFVDISEDELTETDCDDVKSQSDSYHSCLNLEDIGAAAFSQNSVDHHSRALGVWDEIDGDVSLNLDITNQELLYDGLSPELPWALLPFEVSSMTKPFFIAKLANMYTLSCGEFGQDLSKPIDINRIVGSLDDDILRNYVLFDYLSKFFFELLSLLPEKSPLWWDEVVTQWEWDRYKSSNFIKHQLCRALTNMHKDSPVTDDRTMFVASRSGASRVPCFIRLLMPRGMAVYLHARLRSLQWQSHQSDLDDLCFNVKDAGDGNNIGFEIKRRCAQQCLDVYQSKFIHQFLRMGVTQNVCQAVCGCTRLPIKLMTVAYECTTKHRRVHSTQVASAANCSCLKRMFADYDRSNAVDDRMSASGLLGPTSQDLQLFLKSLEKARAQSDIYKAKQRNDINFEQYIQDGMNLDILTKGDYNTRKKSSSRSREPKRQ